MFVPGDPSAGSQPGTPGVAGLNPGEDETQVWPLSLEYLSY
jgi:hypothetical protein